MGFLIGFLIVVLGIVSILLVLIVLIQDDGAEGAGILLGSSASQQYGARKGNIVTRTTGILATLFVSISLILVFLFRENDATVQAIESDIAGETTDQLVQWWSEGDESEGANVADDSSNQNIEISEQEPTVSSSDAAESKNTE